MSNMQGACVACDTPTGDQFGRVRSLSITLLPTETQARTEWKVQELSTKS